MLLEREKELDALAGALAAACEGEGGLVLVEGETGIGKSDLLLAAEDRAFDLEMTTLSARGSELEREFPFGVVLQLLERLVTALPDTEREVLLDGPAGMARPLFPSLRRAGEEPAPEDPLALVHGTYWLFARIAELRPLLVIVDDAQWMDERSVQVLRYLAARVEDLPVAIVAGGTGGLDELARSAEPLRLVLRPLTRGGTARFVLAELPDADEAFCDGCFEASGGVPLLLTELLSAVRNDDLAPTGRTSATFATLGPREVARAVLTRLEALPPGTAALARTAAVLGDDAELVHAARLAGLPLQRAAIALDALCASGIVEPDETIRFRHPLVRSALEASVPPAGREHTHLQAAHALLGEAAPPERVAGHLMAAERGGRRWVVETLRRAAARAMSEGAPASAARHLERALEEPPPSEEVRGEILLELARAEAAAGSPSAPARIRAALEPVDDATARTRALADVAQAPAAGDRPALVSAFEEGLRTAGARGGDPEATRWLEATLLAEAREDPALRRRAAGMLGVAGGTSGRSPASRALAAQRALEAALACEPASDVRELAALALGRGALLSEDRPAGPHVSAALRALAFADDLQSAELAAAVAVERARQAASPDSYARACALRADVSVRRGSLADAVADARAALDAPTPQQATAAAALAEALAEHGDLAEAADVLREVAPDGARDDAREPRSAAARAVLLTARAHVRRLSGEHADAYVDALDAGRLARELDADAPTWIAWRVEAALSLLDGGDDRDAALALAREHLDLARRCAAPRALGQALRVAGMAEGGAQGIALLTDAVKTLERSHAVLERAAALAALGTALRVARDPVAARGPLRDALAIARRAGAVMLESAVHDELARSGDRVRRAELPDADALSPVERRVVDLATDGLDADEIADALFVTPKAVEWHLRSASRKLGVRSREQLLESLSLRD